MKRSMLIGAILLSSQMMIASDTNKKFEVEFVALSQSARRKFRSIYKLPVYSPDVVDLTIQQDRCLPWVPQWWRHRTIYTLGLKTLNSRDTQTTKYGIGSDEDAIRRWTIVAQGIIRADKNDRYTDCCCLGAVRSSQEHAKYLRQALDRTNLQLDQKIEDALMRVDCLE